MIDVAEIYKRYQYIKKEKINCVCTYCHNLGYIKKSYD